MRRLFFFLAILGVTTVTCAAEKPAVQDIFGKLRVCLLDKNGIELPPVAGAEESKVPGPLRQRFQFKDEEIVLACCFDPATRAVVFRVESPHLVAGDVGVGILFPTEKRLPKVAVAGNRATFEIRKGKTLLGWTEPATLASPKPRQELKVSLAEYGATDRWKDVTDMVSGLIVGDSLDFRASNTLFGDVAPGVVKNLVLTYSVGDDEEFKTFGENQAVRIQFNPSDKFFRLGPDKKPAFEFVVAVDLPSLPEKLPTFEEAKKHAASVDVPLVRGMF